ncbi:LacI family DNA-binding transcriptional regulator [Cerasicoccus arenae]|uniref:LacI family transcriptional regulator n=1 Tax=Cerasicoccus arenae TaxID=424488 RepID=A0A8J3GF39_9BACT|nr:LacI family DNA-binding transcriptional regulator [Cerasicoccus arenae]MBK1859067.1 LacI family DNA-binding transcriptional regulator [Cerasicoccus arenae]GHC03457.1 LacI family transcriptional regulator [Cerasicoccus arenae]
MARYVTIKDIANRAEVHYSTVSLALRNDPRLAQETRNKIQALAEEMGYVPSAAMKALCAYRESNKLQPIRSGLAYLTNMPRDDSFGSMVYQRARNKASSLGYDLIQYNLSDADSRLAHFKSIWWNTGISGVMVGPFLGSGNCLDDDWDRFIVVAYGYSVDSPHFSRAVLDHYHNMLTHLEILRSRSYQRIGMILSQNLSNRTHGILHSAYLYDQVKNRAARIPPNSGDIDSPEKMRDWITSKRLDAVIGHRDHYQLILSAGLRIPEDIGFTLIGWKDYEPRTQEHIAGFNSKPEMLAENAVAFLVSQIYEHAYGLPETPRSLMIEGEFHEGETIRRPQA